MARYIEIFLADREPGSGQLVAACFNSMYTSKGIPTSRDTAPQVLVKGLDFEKMKQERIRSAAARFSQSHDWPVLAEAV